MKTLTKSNKKKPLISVLLFQIGLFSTYSQNFSLSDFTSPREITTINNKTSGGDTRNMVTLKGNTQTLTTLKIYSVSGQLVISNLKLQNSEASINISSLKTGIYIIELKNELETRRKKFKKK